MMELTKAIGILHALADGFDPYTGEVFEEGHVFQMPDTVRAMHVALNVLEAKAKKANKKRELPEHAGKPWTDEEHRMLAEEFDTGKNIHLIAEDHKRTIGGIRSRLIVMGKIQY